MSLWRIVLLIVLVVVSQSLQFWITPAYNAFVQRYREVSRLPPEPPAKPWIGGFHWAWVMERQTDASLQQLQRVVRVRAALLMMLILAVGVVWLLGPR